MDCTHWYGPHLHWLWIVPALIMILMFAAAARMFRCGRAYRSGPGHCAGWMPSGCWNPASDTLARYRDEAPGRILDRRYASGKITKEQYEQMKHDIESRYAKEEREEP